MSKQYVEIAVYGNSVELEFNAVASTFGVYAKTIAKANTVYIDFTLNEDIKIALSNDDSITIANGTANAFMNPDTGSLFDSNRDLYDFLKAVIR